MSWSDKEQKRLAELVSQRLSFGRISPIMTKEFGRTFSRNACLARAYRTGLRKGEPTVPAAPKPKRQTEMKPETPKASPKEPETNQTVPDAPKSAPAVPAAFKTCRGAVDAVVALQPGQCRYPVGEVSDPAFHFCGGARKKGSIYCEAHAALCERRGEPRRRSRKSSLSERRGAMAGW